MRRPRIKHICVASTGNTPVVTLSQQRELDHIAFLKWYKTFEEKMNRAPKVETTTTVTKYNPERHKYYVFCGKKFTIRNEAEYLMAVGAGVQILIK